MGEMHLIARMSVQWMIYCLTEGMLLALFAWVLLRLLPRQNAGTRFALWFSVLLATVVLPFIAGRFFSSTSSTNAATGATASSHSLLTLPDSLALGVWGLWAVIAALGLLRVLAGLGQVRRIRQNSEEVEAEILSPEVRATLESFQRPVKLRVSDSVHVPAAIGFLRPAVVIPRWFLEDISSAELQQVVLHELTHLRRRDDWTNLAQKVIKALLFFHPCVWWVEQRLSLEREMACDEAVLAQTASPHSYAQCLTRLAERSFIRKKIALAQAAVSRMQQLSLRVIQILDGNRPSSTRIWKPAVPMVFAAAALCGFSAWNAPALVSFHDDAAAATMNQAQAVLSSSLDGVVQPKLILASTSLDKMANPAMTHGPRKEKSRFLAPLGMTKGRMASSAAGVNNKLPVQYRETRMVIAQQLPADSRGDYVMYGEQVVVTTTGGPGTGQPQMWQVSMSQVSIFVSGAQAGTTVSRKKI